MEKFNDKLRNFVKNYDHSSNDGYAPFFYCEISGFILKYLQDNGWHWFWNDYNITLINSDEGIKDVIDYDFSKDQIKLLPKTKSNEANNVWSLLYFLKINSMIDVYVIDLIRAEIHLEYESFVTK